MRYPNLSATVQLSNGTMYSMANLLNEFIWGAGFWSIDEASVAAFDRSTAALKTKPFALDDKDFDRICTQLRSIQFPPHVAIELSHLRNQFVFSPKEPPQEVSAAAVS